jgi:hypothetical protein
MHFVCLSIAMRRTKTCSVFDIHNKSVIFNGILSNIDLKMVPVAKNTVIIIHQLQYIIWSNMNTNCCKMITELYSFLLQETMDQVSVPLLQANFTAVMYHTFNSCRRGLTVGVHIKGHTWTANLTNTKTFESNSRDLKRTNFLLNPLGSKLIRNIQKL